MIKDRLAKLTREPTDIRFFRSMPGSVDLVVQPAPASTVAEERAEEQADGESAIEAESHVWFDGNESEAWFFRRLRQGFWLPVGVTPGRPGP